MSKSYLKRLGAKVASDRQASEADDEAARLVEECRRLLQECWRLLGGKRG
jgi:hypothetical protein